MIGLITISITIGNFLGAIIAALVNENFDWGYVLVVTILLIPMFVGVSFWINFFSKDDYLTRSKLFVACQFIIISSILLALFKICYMLGLEDDQIVVDISESGK